MQMTVLVYAELFAKVFTKIVFLMHGQVKSRIGTFKSLIIPLNAVSCGERVIYPGKSALCNHAYCLHLQCELRSAHITDSNCSIVLHKTWTPQDRNKHLF